MASYMSDQDVGARLSRPSRGENGRGQRVEWRPHLSPAWPLCMAVVRVAAVPPRWEGGGATVVLWAVRTRRWGRGPAGRGLTLGREPSISRL